MKVEWRDGNTFDPKSKNPEWIWVMVNNHIRPIRSCLTGCLGSPIEKWAPMELPDPPDKKKHLCSHPYSLMYCFEEGDQLWLNCIGSFQAKVNLCPLCGFTLEKK